MLKSLQCAKIIQQYNLQQEPQYILWQYGLSSYQGRDTKLDRFIVFCK